MWTIIIHLIPVDERENSRSRQYADERGGWGGEKRRSVVMSPAISEDTDPPHQRNAPLQEQSSEPLLSPVRFTSLHLRRLSDKSFHHPGRLSAKFLIFEAIRNADTKLKLAYLAAMASSSGPSAPSDGTGGSANSHYLLNATLTSIYRYHRS